jgi:Na+/proline symporter
MFCCKGPRQARLAIIASTAGQLITFTVMLVGAGLFAYYKLNPLTGEALAAYEEKGDRIFPLFILSVIPTGWTGLIIAGVFAAAISSLDSILAALSQTTMSAFYLPLRERTLARRAAVPAGTRGDAPELAEDRRAVLVSRVFVVAWGVILCLMAQLAALASEYYPSILDLGLAMAGYAGGALLAGFLLAFLKLNIDGRGYMWSGPLSVLTVFALVWHQPWTHAICWGGAGALLLVWVWCLMRDAMIVAQLTDSTEQQRRGWAMILRDWPQTMILMVGLAIMLWLNDSGYWEGPIDPETGAVTVQSIAWPWYAPVGSTVAFVFGYLLARSKREGAQVEPA